MPHRRIVRDEEYLRIAADPDAAMARLAELRSERTAAAEAVHTEQLLAGENQKLASELKLKETDLTNRDVKLRDEVDAFFNIFTGMRASLEQREHEVEGLLSKSSERFHELNARELALDNRSAVLDARAAALEISEAEYRQAQRILDGRTLAADERDRVAEKRDAELSAREARIVRVLEIIGDGPV